MWRFRSSCVAPRKQLSGTKSNGFWTWSDSADPVSVSSDGCAEVSGGSGVVLSLPEGMQPPVRSNGRSLIACRPEDVYVEPPIDGPGLNRLAATVETAAYLGEHIEYGVRTAGEQRLLVISPRRHRYDLGAPVSVRVDTTEATLWSGE